MRNYFIHLNNLRLLRKDKSYMRSQASIYTNAALYLLRVIQLGAKSGEVIKDPGKYKSLTVGVNELLQQAKHLTEMAEKNK